MRTVLISSQFHCPRPPWLVCVPDQNRHYAGYYAPFSVPFDLNFWKLRFTHPKKMPVKKYPYAPTLVYFADKHLWHSRQRSRGQECLAPPPTKIWRGHAKPPDALVLKNSFTDVFDIGDFRAHIFCPQTTQELPKKHHEAGPAGTPAY